MKFENKFTKYMLIACILYCSTLLKCIIAQKNDYTTPVPILKQINRHNEDGSYSYGYEAADGSFKIETKYPNGEVYGKYGYVDDTGKVRTVEYGASRRGFEPQGNDINVPPPTLTNSNPNLAPLGPNEEDDGQYREDPSIYYKKGSYNSKPIPASNFRLNHIDRPEPRSYNPPPQPQQYYNSAPVYPERNQIYSPQPYKVQQSHYSPPPPPPVPASNPYHNVNVPTHHHPALQNIDIWSGSYSISYK